LVDKIKGTIILLLFVLLCTSSILAVDNKNVVDLQEIIERALQENIDLQLAELNLEDARLNYKKNQLDNLLSSSRLFELQSELDKIQAEENYKDIRDNLILEVISDYIDIISNEQQLITAQKEVELEEKRVEEVRAQVEVGYKGSLELFEQENDHLAAVNSMEKLKDEMAQKLQELKQKIAIDNNSKIKLVKLVKPEIWAVSEEDVLNTAISNNAVVEIKKKKVILAENDLKKAKVSDTPELDLRKKEIILEKAHLELTQEEQNLVNDVQIKYIQYKQAVKNINMAEKSVIQAEGHFKIIKEQNNAGLVSKNDLLSSELSLYEAENEFVESIINYYISKLNIQKVMGMELEVNLDYE